MKKIYALLAAVLMSASLFAAAPTTADIAKEYDVQNNVVFVIHFIEYAELCYDVRFVGTCNNWGKGDVEGASESWDNCEKFAPIEGLEGWYAAELAYSDGFQGKPLQEPIDRSWTWDYQCGDKDAWVHVDGLELELTDGYAGECNIAANAAGAYIYELKYWKNHKSPCVEMDTTGTCGKDLALTWEYSRITKTLTISGNGEFTDNTGYGIEARTNMQHLIIGNGVTSIGDGAFYGCSGLTSVTIGNGVTSIGRKAFYGCSNITSITWNAKNCVSPSSSSDAPFYNIRGHITSFTFGEEVETIPANLCNGMSNLTSITIPNSVTSIGVEAFRNCSGLTSIEIPNSVTSIGSSAFYGCSNLTSVSWNAKNCASSSYEDYAPFYYIRSNITSFAFGEEVESIPAYLCYGMSNLTSITIPNGVTSIGSGAFWGCSGLTSIEIPNSVTSIGDYAYYGCSGLTSVTIGNSVTSIGNYALSGCSGLTSIEIPNSVTSIGNYALSGCSGLTSIEIPNSVTSIGSGAFWGCSGLTSIEIPNSVTSIGEGAFYGCTHLSKVVAHAQIFDAEESSWAYYTKQLDSVIINNGELTDNVQSVIKRSYKTLKTLDVSAATNTILPDEAFKGYYNLETLKLPANLTQINYMAVAECVNLTTIAIPESVEEIEQRAFENCRSITSIEFGENPSLIKIGKWAFYNCHQLENINLPEGVEEIGAAAFYGCAYAQTAHLPASVQSIGDNAFALCSKLTQMDVDAVLPPEVENKTFYEVSTEAPVYVPAESVDTYKSHAVWGRLNIQGRSNAPTGIESPTTNDQRQTTKILRDGQILIMRGDKVYTVTGQAVK